ncbi:hypothetical protein EFN38_05065 [Leuconostoc mesenteroides]|nr:hypothetical protein [Leuconostoc mesenteroides]
MTFDEAIAKVGTYLKNNDLSNSDNNDRFFHIILNELRQEYAPTVEMTKSQKDLILRNQDEDKLYEIMGDGEGYYFNAEYWGDLEPHEVASAYLHPETIKIVDK